MDAWRGCQITRAEVSLLASKTHQGLVSVAVGVVVLALAVSCHTRDIHVGYIYKGQLILP